MLITELRASRGFGNSVPSLAERRELIPDLKNNNYYYYMLQEPILLYHCIFLLNDYHRRIEEARNG